MECQSDNKVSFKNFAEQIISSEPAKSLTSYALASLTAVLQSEGADCPDEEIIRRWIAIMAVGGKKTSTCKRYFSKAHSVYRAWCGNSGVDPFDAVLPQLNSLQEVSSAEAEHNSDKVRRLLHRSEKSTDRQTAAVFLYLLYNPEATIADAVNLSFGSEPEFCPQITDIVSTFDSSHGRKYVFDLKQGKSRPNEIARNLTVAMRDMLTAAGMRFEQGFSRASITAMWIALALKANVSIRDIRACIGQVPAEYGALAIINAGELAVASKERIICRVADTVNSCATHWYAMKLRPGVGIEDITNAIANKFPDGSNTITTYYPTRKEIRKEGKKRVVGEVPYLPGILFFKTRPDKIKSLFARIGDLAWCFRTSNSAESDYAIIPHRQMADFQRYIGHFTADVKMELADINRSLEKGRMVRISGGIMAGYEGEILDVEDEPGKRVFFLSITGNTKASWTAYVDDVFIEAIE